jgi:hypothetical protein
VGAADYLAGLPSQFDELRERHITAVHAFADAMRAVGDLEDETETVRRAWRVSVREAVSVGDPAPERPFDPAQQQAQKEVAEDDLVAARDALALVVADALDELRSRRGELEGLRSSGPEARHANAGYRTGDTVGGPSTEDRMRPGARLRYRVPGASR